MTTPIVPIAQVRLPNYYWVSLTTAGQSTLSRDPIQITRGRQDWAGQVSPSTLGMSLDNRNGDWSPDNPLGQFHPRLKRNVPVRVGVPQPDSYLYPNDSGPDLAQTNGVIADHNILTSIDVRIEFQFDKDLIDFNEGGVYARLAHRAAGAAGYQWDIREFAGQLQARFHIRDSGGAFHAFETSQSGVELPEYFRYRRVALRFTLNTGTGTGTWYTSDSIGGSWAQLGSPNVVAGATSIGTASARTRVGGNIGDVSTIPFPGKIYAFQIRDGIGGTVVADVDFTALAPGTTAFTDGAGDSWIVETDGKVMNALWRFHGELSSWPVRWALSGNDVWAPIEAAGIFRRLRQGKKRLPSVLRRESVSLPDLVQYWPMEETGSPTLWGAAAGSAPFQILGAPSPAAYSGFSSSDAIPELGAGEVWTAQVDPHTETGEWQVQWLMHSPDPGPGDDIAFLSIETTTLIVQVVYRASTGGSLRVLMYLPNGTLVEDSGYAAFDADGKNFLVQLRCVQDGADIDYNLVAVDAGTTSIGGISDSGTSLVLGRVTRIQFNPTGLFDGVAIGHVTLQNGLNPISLDQVTTLNAYVGERAGRRVQRLCREVGVPSRIYGDPDDTQAMGPQESGSLMDLLQECADTDLGILFEPRESIGVGFRTHSSMLNQASSLALDYSNGEAVGTPRLDRDDQAFANDVTVRNWSGAEARAEVVLGEFSTAEPPDGAGRYDTSFDVSIKNDALLLDHAGFRLALYSPDEPRISSVAVDTLMPAVAGSPTLIAALLDTDLGDLISVDNLLPEAYAYLIEQIVQGSSETIGHFNHRVDFRTTPGSPWNTGLADDEGRYDTAGSELDSAASANATSLSVATTLGPIWTTAAGDFPFDITVDGVRVTVTNITGSSSPQTFTVTGSTVVRGLAAGSKIELADPSLYTL